MIEKKFEANMTVSAALALHPSARWVFAAYQLAGCTSCGASSEETLEQVAIGYRLSLDRLLADLNSVLSDER
jgi:hybrid cluster-associated redox disulfide protein